MSVRATARRVGTVLDHRHAGSRLCLCPFLALGDISATVALGSAKTAPDVFEKVVVRPQILLCELSDGLVNRAIWAVKKKGGKMRQLQIS